MATSTIKPVHAGIDFAFTIGASDWSSSSPFTYTWTNSAVTDGCRVEVEFSSSSQNTEVASISYEKISGGVTFSTEPIKPTTNISVIVHVINAQTGNVIAPTDTSIITSAVTGAANVHEALILLSGDIASINSKITYETVINMQQVTTSYVTRDTYNGRKFSDYALLVFTPVVNSWARVSCIVPTWVFENYTGVDVRFYQGSNLIEVDVKRTSDTTFDAKYIGTLDTGCYVNCFGIFKLT